MQFIPSTPRRRVTRNEPGELVMAACRQRKRGLIVGRTSSSSASARQAVASRAFLWRVVGRLDGIMSIRRALTLSRSMAAIVMAVADGNDLFLLNGILLLEFDFHSVHFHLSCHHALWLGAVGCAIGQSCHRAMVACGDRAWRWLNVLAIENGRPWPDDRCSGRRARCSSGR